MVRVMVSPYTDTSIGGRAWKERGKRTSVVGNPTCFFHLKAVWIALNIHWKGIKSRDTPSNNPLPFPTFNSLGSNGLFSLLPSEVDETNELALVLRLGVCAWLNVP